MGGSVVGDEEDSAEGGESGLVRWVDERVGGKGEREGRERKGELRRSRKEDEGRGKRARKES